MDSPVNSNPDSNSNASVAAANAGTQRPMTRPASHYLAAAQQRNQQSSASVSSSPLNPPSPTTADGANRWSLPRPQGPRSASAMSAFLTRQSPKQPSKGNADVTTASGSPKKVGKVAAAAAAAEEEHQFWNKSSPASGPAPAPTPAPPSAPVPKSSSTSQLHAERQQPPAQQQPRPPKFEQPASNRSNAQGRLNGDSSQESSYQSYRSGANKSPEKSQSSSDSKTTTTTTTSTATSTSATVESSSGPTHANAFPIADLSEAHVPSPTLSVGKVHLKGTEPSSPLPSAKDPSKAPAKTPSENAAEANNKNVIRRKLTGYVGFANLPNQWHRKSLRKGFSFNVMVVGESGLGKSTLVNTLFNTSLYPPKDYKGPSNEVTQTVSIESTSADIDENGVRLRLTVVDTPGFGDFVNNDKSWGPIVENIEQRFDAYLEAENKVNRINIVDNRIHACVYFIQPTGHSLKPIDIEVMRLLHTKVNLIPVIAKSDTLTDEEIVTFRRRILNDINHHKIKIFKSPQYELDDEETIAENEDIVSKIPFAVVGANTEVVSNDGKKVRGRSYPWATIEVDNEDHCDFTKLRQMLIRTHMEELKEHTNNSLYEDYRTDKLLQMGIPQDTGVFKEVNPSVKQEEERSLHENKLEKMEAEMRAVFEKKVREKEEKLKQSESELHQRHKDLKDQLAQHRIELEDRRQKLEMERTVDDKTMKKKGFSLR